MFNKNLWRVSQMTTKSKLPSGMIQRGNVYHANFRARGRQVRKKLDRNLTLAKQLLTEYRHRANQGDFSFLDGGGDLEGLCGDYLADCRLRLEPVSLRIYRRSLALFFDMTRIRRVDQIDVKAVTRFRTMRLGQRRKGRTHTTAVATVNRDITILAAMLNWGVRHGYLDRNPIANIHSLPDHEPRKVRRALDPTEVERLLAVSGPAEREAFLMFLHTGMRSEEVCGLTPADINLDSRTITVTGTAAKSHKAREIPIAAAILEILQRGVELAEERGDGVVIRNRQGRRWQGQTLHRRLSRRCLQAGIKGAKVHGPIDIHSLRGTWATQAIASGADPKSVQAILGHATLEMTLNLYAKATAGGKIAAIEGVSYGPAEKSDPGTLKFLGVRNTDTDPTERTANTAKQGV